MTEIMDMVGKFVATGMDMIHNFSAKEVTLFKFAMMTFGMLVAIYHHKTFKKLSPIIWFVFIVSYAYLIGNYIFYLKARKDKF